MNEDVKRVQIELLSGSVDVLVTCIDANDFTSDEFSFALSILRASVCHLTETMQKALNDKPPI